MVIFIFALADIALVLDGWVKTPLKCEVKSGATSEANNKQKRTAMYGAR
jgi:hypothetical protein